MTGQLTYDANVARLEELHRRAERRPAVRAAARPATPAHRQRRVQIAGSVTIRYATAADRVALERLAALDSEPALAGDVLLAEVDGEAVAAIELGGGTAIADPFRPTVALVELLGLRAAGLRATTTPRRLRLRPRTACRVA